jgi:uncharacterized protein (DUF2236 family)
VTTAPTTGDADLIPVPRATSDTDHDRLIEVPAPRVGPENFDPLDYMEGAAGCLAGLANVILQLSWAPVGYGVMESRVTGGQLTRHPLKRGRTTFTYIAVAWLGDDELRARYREAVNTAHRQVRSTADSPVKYNAFSRDLQLWVAACMYWGLTDFYVRVHGAPEPTVADALYRHAARFGTTLQLPEEMWPADRAAFAEYWHAGLTRAAIDPVVRDYLMGLVSRRGLRFPFNLGPGLGVAFVTTGFLPPPIRDQMGLVWTPADEERFARWLRRLGVVLRRLPPPLRAFPFNVLLRDARRRLRRGIPLV